MAFRWVHLSCECLDGKFTGFIVLCQSQFTLELVNALDLIGSNALHQTRNGDAGRGNAFPHPRLDFPSRSYNTDDQTGRL